MNALRSINPVQFLAPSSSASSYTQHSQPCKMAHKKSENRETECKNGSQRPCCIPNAHLTFWVLEGIFSHNCLQLKVNTQKSNFQSFYIKPRNAMPPVCCWAWTQKALFTFFIVFFWQSCTVTALSSNMHLVVLSHRCVQTIWSVRKPPGPTPNR